VHRGARLLVKLQWREFELLVGYRSEDGVEGHFNTTMNKRHSETYMPCPSI
jgi:hypothetical protein